MVLQCAAVITQAGVTVGDFLPKPKSLLQVFIVPTDGTGAANLRKKETSVGPDFMGSF